MVLFVCKDVNFLGFSIDGIMSSENRNIFYYFFFNLSVFYVFFLPSCLKSTSSTMLNRSSKNGHLRFVPNHREKNVRSDIMLVVVFIQKPFMLNFLFLVN